jgi:acetoin utilization transport system permease protein
MKWIDRLRFVRQNMAKNKSRIFMTVLAAAMGCSFLIMLASVAFGLQNSLVKEITEGQALTRIELYDKKANGEDYVQPDQSDIAVLEAMPYVRAVTPRGYVPTPLIRTAGYETRTNALLVDFAAEQSAGLELSEGRMPERPGEAIVGYHYREALVREDGTRYEGELLGLELQMEISEIQVDGETGEEQQLSETEAAVTIVGIAKKPAREYVVDTELMLDRNMYEALMPHSAAQGLEAPIHTIYVYADDASHLTKLTSAMRAEGYRLYSPSDQIEEMELFFTVMKIGLGFVGTIAVLIASIGIFNTMTMAVTERAQDIGIMKAIGASPRTIRSIFLLESAGIGILGAILGGAVSYALSYVVNAVLPPILSSVIDSEVPAGFTFSSIPAGLTIVSVAISLIVAMLSGMRPAARATRIDVLRALRRDL